MNKTQWFIIGFATGVFFTGFAVLLIGILNMRLEAKRFNKLIKEIETKDATESN